MDRNRKKKGQMLITEGKQKVLFCVIVRTREKIQDNYMKYNGPCADTAGSAGEGLRKTKEEHQ